MKGPRKVRFEKWGVDGALVVAVGDMRRQYKRSERPVVHNGRGVDGAQVLYRGAMRSQRKGRAGSVVENKGVDGALALEIRGVRGASTGATKGPFWKTGG